MFISMSVIALNRNYWKQNIMQAVQKQPSPRAIRDPLTFTMSKLECGIDIFQMRDDQFSEREISFLVTEAIPGQRRSAALDASFS